MGNTAIAEPSAMSDWQVICEQSQMLLKSGFLPQSIKSPEQALAIILQGRELGIGPMAALNNISIIQGKPTVSPQLMLAMANSTREVEDVQITSSEQGATVTIKRKGRKAHTTTFGPKDAKAMGLDGKDNYKKQPATMYQWRAVAANLRVTFADVILGLYTPDEMGAVVDEEGSIESGFNEPLRETVTVSGEIVDDSVVVTDELCAQLTQLLLAKMNQADVDQWWKKRSNKRTDEKWLRDAIQHHSAFDRAAVISQIETVAYELVKAGDETAANLGDFDAMSNEQLQSTLLDLQARKGAE
jgi:hypothetical protein